MIMPGSKGEPYLLTPGPLTTSPQTKHAMLRDWGSRDAAFIALTRRVRDRLVALAHGEGMLACVPIQGSGTFAVEAMLGTFVPRGGHVLVLINGAYGRRMRQICQTMGRAVSVLETAEEVPADPGAVVARLAGDDSISHVAAVHCETTTGILNPIEDIARVVADAGRRLLIDAMSSFGALAIDARSLAFDALAASANKCLEGVPGVGFVLARQDVLAVTEAQAHSVALDLYEQWRGFEGNGQWRFTPPTHVMAALDAALDQLDAEGGVAGRLQRYRQNCAILIDGMRALGFESLLPDALQAPIIVTFRIPPDVGFDFEIFHDKVRARGYALYPGKLAAAPSFRIGCIGQLGVSEMRGALDAIAQALDEMKISLPSISSPRT